MSDSRIEVSILTTKINERIEVIKNYKLDKNIALIKDHIITEEIANFKEKHFNLWLAVRLMKQKSIHKLFEREKLENPTSIPEAIKFLSIEEFIQKERAALNVVEKKVQKKAEHKPEKKEEKKEENLVRENLVTLRQPDIDIKINEMKSYLDESKTKLEAIRDDLLRGGSEEEMKERINDANHYLSIDLFEMLKSLTLFRFYLPTGWNADQEDNQEDKQEEDDKAVVSPKNPLGDWFRNNNSYGTPFPMWTIKEHCHFYKKMEEKVKADRLDYWDECEQADNEKKLGMN